MKYYTEKEQNEIQALMILAESDRQKWSNAAKDALKEIKTIGVEIAVDDVTIIDGRVIDDNSELAVYITDYDKYIAYRNDSAKNFKITITMINLLTGEIIFDARYEKYNNGEGISIAEDCARKELREII